MSDQEWKGVLVFIEVTDGKVQEVGWELLGEAKKLASKINQNVQALIIGHDVEKFAKDAIAYGADVVYVVDDPGYKNYITKTYAKAFVEIVNKHKPDIALIGATNLGRDLSGAIATVLKAGLTADCTGLDIDDQSKALIHKANIWWKHHGHYLLPEGQAADVNGSPEGHEDARTRPKETGTCNKGICAGRSKRPHRQDT